MAPGIRQLAAAQGGQEGTAGTETNATFVWRGPIPFPEDVLVFKQPKEDVARFGGTDRSYISQYGSKWNFPETEATFEQFPYFLQGSIKDLRSGVQDGSGTDYIRAYALSLTSANTLATYTLEAYDNTQEEQALYCFCKSWKLSGKGGPSANSLMMSAEWAGRQLAPGTKTAALAVAPVNEMLFAKSKLYIDAIGGTIGTTQKTNTFMAFDIAYDSGIVQIWTGDGSLDFTFIKIAEPKLTGSVMFEHDAIATAQKAIWRAQTPQLMRIKCEGGTAFGTPGTTYTYPTLLADMAFKWTKFDVIDEQDGNDIVLGHYESKYNTTAAVWATFTVVNELSALT